MKIRKTVGIDLGTTNSVIALLDATDSALVAGQDEQGQQDRPLGRRLPGPTQRPARRRPRRRGPQGAARPPPSPRSSATWAWNARFAVGPETLTPPQVSARVLLKLRELLAYALNDAGYLLDSAIITMPAYFNHNQIEATRQAGELAGYEVVELLHEPTAAAIYYSWLENHGDATYLVYDLGGGTFDVSVIRRRFDDYEVLSVSGDPFLGGDDFDRLLASHLLAGIGDRELGDRGRVGRIRQARPRRGGDQDRADHPRARGALHPRRADGGRRPAGVADRGRGPGDVPAAHQGQGGSHHRLLPRSAGPGPREGRRPPRRHRLRRPGRRLEPRAAGARNGAGRLLQPDLPEHVRHAEPLLHEPDLCVAYGAALRAATHGTRYLFPDLKRPHSFLPDLDLGLGLEEPALELEVHVTSPANVPDTAYTLGRLRARPRRRRRCATAARSACRPADGPDRARRSSTRTAASPRSQRCARTRRTSWD